MVGLRQLEGESGKGKVERGKLELLYGAHERRGGGIGPGGAFRGFARHEESTFKCYLFSIALMMQVLKGP